MKKTKFLISLVLTFLLSFYLASAADYDSPQTQVTLLSQSPDPVEPGQTVKLKFKVENLGIQSKVDNIVKLLPKFPFTLYGDPAEKNIGKLRAEQTGSDAVIVEFNLKVDEKAVEGDTEVELMVKITEDAWISYTDDEFLVDIQTHDAVLDITRITSQPEKIPPGASAQINILVKNLADSLLKDIKFKLDFESSTLPLAPYQSSSERRISQLETGYQKALTFQLIADPEAAAGLYKIPLNITYNDEKGNSYLIEDTLAVLVGEKPLLRLYIKKSSVRQANREGKITLEIANAGTTNIKFLELLVLPSPDFQLLSPTDYFYLGDVDSDDTESEEIDLFINKKVKTLHLPVLLKYDDANNQPYQKQFDLELALYSPSQLRKFGILEKSRTWIYGLLLIIAGLGYLVYRRYKKKKQ